MILSECNHFSRLFWHDDGEDFWHFKCNDCGHEWTGKVILAGGDPPPKEYALESVPPDPSLWKR